jgi:hypothetical protein
LLRSHNFCGNDENPGHDEVPEWQVWTDRETTRGQARIEESLEGIVGRATSIFHVGVGNSGLALRFGHRVAMIHGITLHQEEKARADRLRIPNYAVWVINKYSSGMTKIRGGFDFIVDNNPSSFACCFFHFCRMMVCYREMLCGGGVLLTDALGLGWVTTGGDSAWSLDWVDWVRLAEALTMTARQLTPTVYALAR